VLDDVVGVAGDVAGVVDGAADVGDGVAVVAVINGVGWRDGVVALRH
jgi:hypothetical protein